MKKRNLLLMLLVALFMPWAANAQNRTLVTIGDGTSTQYYPLPGFYGFQYDVFLYTPSAAPELGVDCEISSLAFDVTSNNTTTGAEMYIWVKDVDADYALAAATTFNEYITDATQVYANDEFTSTTGWNTFSFESTFSHEGGKALLVAVRGVGCTTGGGCSRSCRYTSASNTWWGKHVDYTDPGQTVSGTLNSSRANIQLDLTYTGAVCFTPSGLTYTNVVENAATLSWNENGSSTAWVLEYSTASDYAGATTVNVSGTPTTSLTGLSALTTYYVRVKADCGSDWLTGSFNTTAVAEAVGDAWSDDFEGTACEWELVNGTQTNVWAWGTAVNNGGSHSLYVSNDNGTTNAYSHTASTVFATKLLNFTEGKFEFSYNWKANGESTYDYLRVALAPADATITAGNYNFTSSTLPTGWIALDGGSKLNLVTAWQSQSVAVNVPAGNYYLVMAWRNDGGGGTNPPAAVDNVSITRVACGYDVTDLAAGNITTNSADITWTAGEATGWQVAYKTNEASEWTENEPVSTNSAPLSGLAASTYYQVKVRAYCGGEDFGSWCAPITFVTKCEAISTYPWTENFDSYTGATSGSTNNLPLCWNYINTCSYSTYKGYPVIYSASGYSHSGNNHLRFYSFYSSYYSSYDPQDQYAILPEMENLNGKQLSLFARGANTNSSFKVGLMTDPTDVNTFVEIATTTPTTGYVEYTYNLTGTGNYIAIMMEAANSTATSRTVYIDDITIAEPPACPKPTDLTVVANSATPHSVQLSWVSDASAWIVAYKTADDEDFTEVNATENPYTLTGLTDGKTYTAKVCAVCDGTPGEWTSTTVSFTTPIACPAPTNLAYSGTTGSQTTLNWAGTSDSYDVLYRTAAYAEGIYEDFGTSIPSGWEMYTGLLTNGTATMEAVTYSWSFGTGNGVFDNHARVNIYSNNQRWLVTKAFTVLQDASTLSFDLALTAFTGNDVPAPATTGTDDKFIVLISTDNMSSWITLREWNNSGSEYVYNNIANTATGENVVIDLSAYVGQNVRIAFYGESTESNADNNLHIDNVHCGIPHEAGEWQTAAEGVTGTTYTLTGLNPETDYEAKVLSNCEGETGHETIISFTTEAACMVPTELTAVSFTTTTAVLTWTSSSTAWQIQVNEEEPIDVTAIPYTLEGLTPATTYTFKVRAYCDDSYTEWSNAASFTTECDAITTFPWSEDFENYNYGDFNAPCWVNEHISGDGTQIFKVYTSSNGSNSTHQLQLPDMSSGTMTKLMLPEMTLPGDDYLFSIDVYRNTTSTSYAEEGIRVFASTDGEIEGATELAFISRNYTVSDENLIPAESTSGWYTYELPIGISGTCYIILRGESKYGSSTYMDNFAVKQIPTCLKPTALECTATTTTTATFSWTNGAADQTAWQICLNGDETNLIMANSNPFTVEGLTASTSYTAKVRAYCSEEDQSEWSDEVSFATECEVIAAEGYSENFDSYEVASYSYYPSTRVLPNCWSAINTTTDYGYDALPSIYYYSYTNYANSTPNCLKLYSYYEYDDWYYEENDPQPQYAILPEMTGLAGMQVTLQARGYNTSSTFKIGTMSDPSDASTFTMIVEQTGLTNSYQEFEYLIPADCQNRYLAIMIDAANSSREYNGVYIDDIVISTPPTCLKPTDLEVTATTATTATFSWTNGAADQTAWQICLNGDETNLIMANSNPFTLEEGLTAGTSYTAKVRAYCDADDQSDWSNEVSFATDCEAYTITAEAPYTQDFERPVVTTTYSQVGEMPVCWENYPATSASAKILAANATYNYAESGQVLYFYGTGNNYAVLPEFTNALNTLQISFKYATESDSYGTLTLGYITDEDENYNSFTAIEGGTFAASSASDDTFVDVDPIDLSALPANATRLVFRWYYTGQWGCNVDDVEVSLLPATTVTQTIELVEGWNWVSIGIAVEDPVEMFEMLTESLGENATEIQAFEYMSEYFDGEWEGDLNDMGVTNEQMYLINAVTDCTIELQGQPAIASEYEITLNPGWNWIGFPSVEPIAVADALAEFAEAEDEDEIQSQENSLEYYDGEWEGDLEVFEPGQGLLYYNSSDEVKTLVFSTAGAKKSTRRTVPGLGTLKQTAPGVAFPGKAKSTNGKSIKNSIKK